MKLKIGDRVKIKENSKFHLQAYDPELNKYLLGRIIGSPYQSLSNNYRMWVRVVWDNKYENNYPVEDIICEVDLIDKMLNIIEKYESR